MPDEIKFDVGEPPNIGFTNDERVGTLEKDVNRILKLKQPLAAIPSFSPSDFPSQIQFYKVGADKKIYANIDNEWVALGAKGDAGTNGVDQVSYQNLTFGETITKGDPVMFCLTAVGSYVAGKVYKSDTAVLTPSFPFIGFANENGVVDEVKQVQITNVFTSLTGMTAAKPYYLADKLANLDYSAAVGSNDNIYGAIWRSETFLVDFNGILKTPNLATVVLNLKRVGALTGLGNVTIGIYATSGGLPTGSAIKTATMAGTDLTTSYAEYTFTFNQNLTANTTYAIVISFAGGDSSHYVQSSYATTSYYANGQRCTSTNSGSSWTAAPTTECWFKVNYNDTCRGDIALFQNGKTNKLCGYSLSATNIFIQYPTFTNKTAFAVAQAAIAEGTTDITYAHGFGITPNWVKLSMMQGSSTNIQRTDGYYDSSGQKCIYVISTGTAGVGSDYIITIFMTSWYQSYGTVVAVDETNITIRWVVLAGGTPAMKLLFECGV